MFGRSGYENLGSTAKSGAFNNNCFKLKAIFLVKFNVTFVTFFQAILILGVYGSLLTAKLMITVDQSSIRTNDELMQALR